MDEAVHAGSLVTLRYRLSCSGKEIVSTMEGHPSTFQLGTGELAPPLEECLLGMVPGSKQGFTLLPDAFGAHNQQLVRRIPRQELPADMALEIGSPLSVQVSPGQQATGLVCELKEDAVLLDLNHPFAGKSVIFEVDVIGVL